VERLELTAADGVRLAAVRLAGPAAATVGASFVLVHGFTNSSRSPGIFRFANALAAYAPVVVLDLRGHGRSGGTCAFGVDEPLDVDAAVRWLRESDPDVPIVTVGSSLGGSTVLLHAGTFGGVSGVVAVSPSGWSGADDRPGSAAAQRAVRTTVGRMGLRIGTGVRLPSTCPVVPDARDVVAAIAPAFTLLVHDPADRYFGPEHCETLERWARSPVDRWEVPGGGHGTDLLDAQLAQRVVAHAAAHVGTEPPGSG